MMTGKQYYYYAFLTPLVLPLVLLALESMLGWGLSWSTTSFTGFLMMSVLFGGIPYLVLLAGFYWWANDKKGKHIHLVSYLVPIVYLVIFFFWLGLYKWLTDPVSPGEIVSYLFSMALWEAFYVWGKIVLPVAYAYIFLFNILFWILKGTRVIR